MIILAVFTEQLLETYKYPVENVLHLIAEDDSPVLGLIYI